MHPFRAARGELFAALVGLSACAPSDLLARGDADCERGFDDSCAPDTCGDTTWGRLALDEQTIYVDDGTTAGDGTPTKPLATVEEGLNAAIEAGFDRVVLAAGTYEAHLTLDARHDGLELAGRCAALVALDAAGAGESLSLDDADAAVTISGVTMRGAQAESAESAGLIVRAGSLTLRETHVTDTRGTAVLATGENSRVTLQDVEISEAFAIDEVQASGLALQDGAGAWVESATLHDIEGWGILLQDSALDLYDVSIQNIAFDGSSTSGGSANGGGLFGERCAVGGAALLVESLVGTGIRVESCALTLDGLAAREIDKTSLGKAGQGIVLKGGEATLSDVSVEHTLEFGIAVSQGSFSVDGLDVRDVVKRPGEEASTGVELGVGSVFDATDITLEHNDGLGLTMLPTATATIESLDVSTTWRTADFAVAVGVYLDEASLEVARLWVHDTSGPGIVLAEGATLRCETCRIEDNSFAGAVVLRGSSLSLGPDSTVTGTGVDQAMGGGVGILTRGTEDQPTLLDLVGVSLASNSRAGLYLDGPGTYDLVDSQFEGGIADATPAWPSRNAILAVDGVTPWTGESGLRLRGCLLHDAAEGALVLSASSATLDGNTWDENSPDVVQQGCASDTAHPEGLDEVSAAEICAAGDRPVDAMEWYLIGNDVAEY